MSLMTFVAVPMFCIVLFLVMWKDDVRSCNVSSTGRCSVLYCA